MSSKTQSFPTITQTFLNRVRSAPDKKAFFSKVGTEWKATTWKDYHGLVREIALGIQQLGLSAGEKVALISTTRIEWAACDMAILANCGVTVPVYPSNTHDDVEFILQHSESAIVFVEDAKQLDKVLHARSKLTKLKKIVIFDSVGAHDLEKNGVLTLSALRALGADKGDKDQFEKGLLAAKPTDVFTICYTSGTTGVPKGVVLTYDSLSSMLEDVGNRLGRWVSDEDTVLSFLPASHIFGRIESMAAYHFGWTTYYAESIEKILLNLGEVGPTILFAVPRIFEKAYNRIKANIDESSSTKRKLFAWASQVGRAYYGKIWEGKRPTSVEFAKYQVAKKLVFSKVYARFGGRIKFCIAGGAPLPKEIGEFMRIVGISILEGYGLTETCAAVTVNTPDEIKFGSIGKPLPEVAIKIADDGEILIKSRKVFKEYYKNPEATKEALDSNGWFHTGDIGVIDGEGFVKITDRKKDIIVTSGGKNVAPQKIENLAKTHKYISQFVVIGDRRNYLSALVVLEKDEAVKFAKE
ncbi:MAG TPA: long-chain fatty acid--CoA ligase, partial [Oligoflexia bacterium]|nr:long-chain fatty acid--CoA ligase [Oligoflexia bacterium]